MNTKLREKRNVPEFEAPPEEMIQRVRNKNESLTESEIISLSSIPKNYFYGSYHDYIFKIIFPESSKLREICTDSFSVELNPGKLFSNFYSLVLPPTLQIIRKKAFEKCSFLTQISFSKDTNNCCACKIIGDEAFRDTAIESMVIPYSVEIIGSDLFPPSLKQLEFENGTPHLTSIGRRAFKNAKFEVISMPKTLFADIILPDTFLFCRHLSTIIFDQYADPDQPIDFAAEDSIDLELMKNDWLNWRETIYPSTFSIVPEGGSLIEENYIANSYPSRDFASILMFAHTNVQNIEIFQTNINKFLFYNTPNLTNIQVKPNGRYTKKVGVLYTNDFKKLIVAQRNLKNVVVNSKCELIANYALNSPSITQIVFEDESNLQEISFSACSYSSIKTIRIPDTCKYIGIGAFYKCQDLKAVSLPQSLLLLSNSAFAFTNIQEIEIPQQLGKLGYACFLNCKNLKEVTFEDSSNCTSIGTLCFSSTSITTITIPKRVELLGDFCFKNCQNLKKIKFENNSNLIKIGAECFMETAITTISLPRKIQHFDFSGTLLKKITFAPNSEIEQIDSRAFFETQIEEISLPSSVTEIRSYAFSNCKKLKTIKMDNSQLRKIESFAFYDCESLTTFDLPSTINFFGKSCFQHCSNLALAPELTEMDTITVESRSFCNSGILFFKSNCNHLFVGTDSFNNCAQLTSVSLSVKESCRFDQGAFKNCENLTEFILNPDVPIIKIKKECFMNSGINRFVVPLHLKTINQSLFRNCRQLTQIEINENCVLNSIKPHAFRSTSIQSIFISRLIDRIYQKAFYKCLQLSEIKFDEKSNLNRIEYKSFSKTGIKRLDIPNSVKKIEFFGFSECPNLESFSFPKMYQLTLSPYIFYNCKSLKQFNAGTPYNSPSPICEGCDGLVNCIPQNPSEFLILWKMKSMTIDQFKMFLDSIKTYQNTDTYSQIFYGSPSKPKQDILGDDNYYFANELNDIKIIGHDNYFIERMPIDSDNTLSDKRYLSYFPVSQTLNDITYNYDKDRIIRCNLSICEATILKEAKIINDRVFMFSNLQKVNFEDNSQLKTIGKFAFFGTAIEEISLPVSLEVIDDSAFESCILLKTVNIKQNCNLQRIGKFAFSRSSIEKILFPKTLTEIDEYAFSHCKQLRIVDNKSNQINFATKSFYESTIEAIKFPLTAIIGPSAFANCINMKKIVFRADPLDVTFCDSSFAFTGIESLYFTKGKITIEPNAFFYCASLTKIGLYNDDLDINLSLNSFAFSGVEKMKLKWLNDPFLELNSLMSSFNFLPNLFYLNIELSDQNILYSHGYQIVNGVFTHADLFDNSLIYMQKETPEELSITDSNEEFLRLIKKNEVLTVPKEATKFELNTMTHIKLIHWSHDCIFSDFGFERMFSYSNLFEIRIPKLVKIIPAYTFDNCHYLSILTFDDDSELHTIKSYAFANTRLKKIVLPPSVQHLEDHCFFNIPQLQQCDFSGETIGDYAFSQSGLTSFVVSNHTKYIGKWAFAYCKSLSKFTINPEESLLSTIEEHSFVDTNIDVFLVPRNVTAIKKGAFKGCKSLKEVVFPQSSMIESIEPYSFADTAQLRRINIPNTIKNFSTKAIINTPSLRRIMYESNDEFVVMSDRSVYKKDRTLIFVPRNIHHFKVVKQCPIIESGAFCGPDLEAIAFTDDESLVMIKRCAFAHCTNIKSLTFPKSLKFLGSEAFCGCTNLETVNLDPESELFTIPKFCFAFSGLTSITLPASVENIQPSAFYFCLQLSQINLFETNVRFIGDHAFSNTSIQNVKFPPTVHTISRNVFDGDTKLEMVDLVALSRKNTTSHFQKHQRFVSKKMKDIKGYTKYVADDVIRNSIPINPEVYNDERKKEQIEAPPAPPPPPPPPPPLPRYLQEEVIEEESVHETESEVPGSILAITRTKTLGSIVRPSRILRIRMQNTRNNKPLSPRRKVRKSFELPGPKYDLSKMNNFQISEPAYKQYQRSPRTAVKTYKTYRQKAQLQTIRTTVSYNDIEFDPIDFNERLLAEEEETFENTPSNATEAENEEEEVIEKDPRRASKHLFIDYYAFSGCSVKTFQLSQKGYRWYNFFDSCKQLQKVISSKNIEMEVKYIDKPLYEYLNKEEPIFKRLSAIYQCRNQNHYCFKHHFCNPCFQILTLKYQKQKVGPFLEFSSIDKFVFDKYIKILRPFSFYGCSQLVKIAFDPKTELKIIPKGCFSFTKLVLINLPNSIEVIDDYAFAQCSSLKLINFTNESNLRKIGKDAFYQCASLSLFTIPGSVETIGMRAFGGCKSLKAVTFDMKNEKLQSIPKFCFASTSIESIELPTQIKTIAFSAFSNCLNLTRIVFNNNLQRIGENAFLNNVLLTEISLPNSLETIEKGAFSLCSKLAKIHTTPDSKLIEVFDDAFGYTSISEIYLNNEAKTIFNPRNVPKLRRIGFYNGNPINFTLQTDGTLYEHYSPEITQSLLEDLPKKQIELNDQDNSAIISKNENQSNDNQVQEPNDKPNTDLTSLIDQTTQPLIDEQPRNNRYTIKTTSKSKESSEYVSRQNTKEKNPKKGEDDPTQNDNESKSNVLFIPTKEEEETVEKEDLDSQNKTSNDENGNQTSPVSNLLSVLEHTDATTQNKEEESEKENTDSQGNDSNDDDDNKPANPESNLLSLLGTKHKSESENSQSVEQKDGNSNPSNALSLFGLGQNPNKEEIEEEEEDKSETTQSSRSSTENPEEVNNDVAHQELTNKDQNEEIQQQNVSIVTSIFNQLNQPDDNQNNEANLIDTKNIELNQVNDQTDDQPQTPLTENSTENEQNNEQTQLNENLAENEQNNEQTPLTEKSAENEQTQLTENEENNQVQTTNQSEIDQNKQDEQDKGTDQNEIKDEKKKNTLLIFSHLEIVEKPGSDIELSDKEDKKPIIVKPPSIDGKDTAVRNSINRKIASPKRPETPKETEDQNEEFNLKQIDDEDSDDQQLFGKDQGGTQIPKLTKPTENDDNTNTNETQQINNEATNKDNEQTTNENQQSINEITNQTDQTDQANHTEQTEQADQTEQTNQTDQTEQTEQTNQTDQTEQTEQTNQTDQTEQTEQTNQTDQTEQTEQANQTDQLNQTEQTNEDIQANNQKNDKNVQSRNKVNDNNDENSENQKETNESVVNQSNKNTSKPSDQTVNQSKSKENLNENSTKPTQPAKKIEIKPPATKPENTDQELKKEEDEKQYRIVEDSKFKEELVNEFNYKRTPMYSIIRKCLKSIQLPEDQIPTQFLKLRFAPKNATTLCIPSNCISIGNNVFDDMPKLKSIEYSKGPTNFAFQLQQSSFSRYPISQIHFTGKFALIDKGLFRNCQKLKIVDFSNDTKIYLIPSQAFMNTSIQKINIPSSCSFICDDAFANCSSLKFVTFSNNSRLTAFGKSCFSNCSSLVSIVIPNGCKEIGELAFLNCTKLSKVQFGQASSNKRKIRICLNSIKHGAFMNCHSINVMNLPNSVSLIESQAFMNCVNLTECNYHGSKIEKIYYRTFFNCSKLNSIKFDKLIGFKSINIEAFMNCSSLKSIEIISNDHKLEETTQTIKERAFCNCQMLEFARFQMKYLGMIHNEAFLNCVELKRIEFNSIDWGNLVHAPGHDAYKNTSEELVIYVSPNEKLKDGTSIFAKDLHQPEHQSKLILPDYCMKLNTDLLGSDI